MSCVLALSVVLSARHSVVGTSPVAEDRETENLAAFARVFGVVRYFCPSVPAAKMDWDRLAMVGAETTRRAQNDDELRASLEAVFAPIVPDLSLAENRSAITREPGPNAVVFWQYRGIKLSDRLGL